MENSTFNILSTLESILTLKNIEVLKKSYIKDKFEKHEQPINLNQELGILDYYDPVKNDITTLNFQNYLDKILSIEIKYCKEAIDSSLILLDSITRIKFIEYIKSTILYIEKNESELLTKFPVCRKPLEEIITFLINKYNIDLLSNPGFKNSESLFKVKSGISKNKFIKLYDITIHYEIINDEFISEETFVSVLLDNATNEKIIFCCNNGLAMMYLKTISALFDNMKGKTIENSGRFRTQTGTLISETNFNKGKTDISIKDKKTLSDFITDFNLLLV